MQSRLLSDNPGLLAPRERNKTLTALAGAEPVTGSKLPAVQRLRFFSSESVRDPGRVNARRLELLLSSPVTGAATGQIVLQQAAQPPEES